MIWAVEQTMTAGVDVYAKMKKPPVNIQTFVVGDFPLPDAKGQVEYAAAKLVSPDNLGRSGFYYDDEEHIIYTIRKRMGSISGMYEYLLEEHERNAQL